MVCAVGVENNLLGSVDGHFSDNIQNLIFKNKCQYQDDLSEI